MIQVIEFFDGVNGNAEENCNRFLEEYDKEIDVLDVKYIIGHGEKTYMLVIYKTKKKLDIWGLKNVIQRCFIFWW